MTNANARFWIYWNGDYVKLTLKPGRDIHLWHSQLTDEGFSSVQETYFHGGNEVVSTIVHESRDCDGRHSYYWRGYCPLSELQARDQHEYCLVRMPNWEKEASSQRDQFAELSNY